MNAEDSPYLLLYNEIILQIQTGHLKAGDSLPVSADFCEKYGLSYTLVRKALLLLEKDHYIELRRGRPPKVIFTAGDDPTLRENYIHELLQRKDSTIQIYHMVSHYFPEVMAQGAKACSKKEIQMLFSILDSIKEDCAERDKFLRQQEIIGFILKKTQNPLLAILWNRMMFFIRTPLAIEKIPQRFKSIKTADYWAYLLRRLLQAVSGEDFDSVRALLAQYFMEGCDNFILYSELIYEELRMKGFSPVVESISFSWNPILKNHPLYAQVANHLIKDIYNGVYERDTLLPCQSDLAKIYSVSEITIRKALQVLTEMDVITAHSGVGTKVVMREKMDSHLHRIPPLLREPLLTSFYALHIMVMISPVIAAEGIDRITEEELEEMTGSLDGLSDYELNYKITILCFEMCGRHARLEPAYELCQELCNILRWARLLFIHEKKEILQSALQANNRRILKHLHERNAERFSQDLFLGISFIFQGLKETLLKSGFQEVEPIDI